MSQQKNIFPSQKKDTSVDAVVQKLSSMLKKIKNTLREVDGDDAPDGLSAGDTNNT